MLSSMGVKSLIQTPPCFKPFAWGSFGDCKGLEVKDAAQVVVELCVAFSAIPPIQQVDVFIRDLILLLFCPCQNCSEGVALEVEEHFGLLCPLFKVFLRASVEEAGLDIFIREQAYLFR